VLREAARPYDPGVSDFSIRAVTLDDAVVVHAVQAAAESVDRTGVHYTVADVVEELESPMIDLAHDWLLVESGGQVVAHFMLTPRPPADGALSVDVWGAVHPDHRRQGISSHVVPLLVSRARDYVRERGADLRPVITGAAMSEDIDIAEIFEGQGLRPHRWTFLMEADLSGTTEPSPALPDGYDLSTWEGVDHEEMRTAHNHAFAGHPGFTPWSPEMWTHRVVDTRNSRPELSLVARDEAGAVAAYLQTSEFDATFEATGKRDAFVSKLGTMSRYRRRGLAGALLGIAMHSYREAGFDSASLDVDSENPTGALGIYEGAGFRTTRRWTNYLLED
jgi:mycothiol synthase